MTAKHGGSRPRRQPQRTCIACREVAGKRGLLRIVRKPSGDVEYDKTGKKSGRGAYLHASRECVTRALAEHLLGRALKTQIGPDTTTRLLGELEAHEQLDDTMTRG